MMAPFRLLERQRLTAPLGVRFWDVAVGSFVTGGLRVKAHPKNDPRHFTHASANRSGSYVLHHAWGLTGFEMGIEDIEFTDVSPPRRRFTVEVTDDQRRFLPVKFDADLPYKGLFRWQTTAERAPQELPGDSPSVPLYSSILRTAPPGMAILRAELYEGQQSSESSTMKPAAWAVLEARMSGRLLGRGLADERGRITLIFAYPAPQDSTASLPFLQQEWAIELQAYYEPTALAPPPVEPGSTSKPNIPNLTDILDQSPVSLFLDQALTEPLLEVTLMFGPKAFVHPSSSLSPLNLVPLSILFVSPADSPPS